MSDLISRQAAIDVAERADYTGLAIEDVKKVTDEVIKELKKLPSAEPFVIKMKRFVKADELERLEKELYRKMTQQSLIFIEPDMELVYPTIEPEQRWIPVTERLPELEQYVLVTDSDGDVEIAMLDESWEDDHEDLVWWLEEYGRIEVTAWMPLPEPYKEKE